MKSKYAIYDEEIKRIFLSNPNFDTEYTKVAQLILKTKQTAPQNADVNALKVYVRRNKKRILDLNEGIYNATDELDVAFTSAKNLWIKTKRKDGGVSGFIVNPNYVAPEEKQIKDIDFESIFNGKIKPIEVISNCINEGLFDRLVYTDVHIGMNVNPDGYSLYGGKWDEHEIEERLTMIVSHVVNNKKSETLYIDELGDFMDGWDAQTVRKGHELPQNMDNQKAYDVGVSFKIRMIDELVKHYKNIICNNICNDNHAGAFGYVVNSAFKTIIELKYSNVKVNNLRKFINHYSFGNYTFILTHGKDAKNLKFGFKAKLDIVAMEKIDNYIKEHYLYKENVVIEFSKGDSHQYVFDNSTSQTYSYCSYPALSPSSEWVQTNFKKGISGFVFFNFYEDRKVLQEYFFKWKN
jgi:hypothetical protein